MLPGVDTSLGLPTFAKGSLLAVCVRGNPVSLCEFIAPRAPTTTLLAGSTLLAGRQRSLQPALSGWDMGPSFKSQIIVWHLSPQLPLAVGTAGMSSMDAVSKAGQGLKGKMVEMVQVYGDCLCEWNTGTGKDARRRHSGHHHIEEGEMTVEVPFCTIRRVGTWR